MTQVKPTSPHCTWTQRVNQTSFWDTSCNLVQNTGAHPHVNLGWKFCPGCGQPFYLRSVKTQLEEETTQL